MYGVNVGGTESHRFAMNVHPIFSGLNCQTMPKALRFYCVPPPGRVFMSGDLSQAEARHVAYDANCNDLIDLFKDPTRHLHMENALLVFGHEVIKDSPEYVVSKSVVHGVHYREGPFKLSTTLGLPVNVTRRLRDNYMTKRPEIPIWHTRVWNEIKERGYLMTALGDKRTFYEAMATFSMLGKMTDKQWKDAIAWKAQTCIPHVTNIGIIRLYDAFKGDPEFCWFHHQGHDSYVVSIPIGEEQRFADVAGPAFTVPLVINGQELIIPTELSVGYNFGDMMAFKGGSVSRAEWESWLASKLTKQSREQQILTGVYSIHLKDWRPE